MGRKIYTGILGALILWQGFQLQALAQQKTSSPMQQALSRLSRGEYEAAGQELSAIIRLAGAQDSFLVQKAKKHLRDCEFALESMRHPQEFNLLNLGSGVNSSSREYLPVLTGAGTTMIFSRTVDENEDFYTSVRKNGTWQPASPLSDQINTRFNEGAQSVTPDGQYLFFTGCNRPGGQGSCDLYVSRRKGARWETPFNLGSTVNSSAWDAQPSVSPDGNTLYFASNRPGGYGGNDLWKTTLDTAGNWTSPVNLGPGINTPYNEQTPFIHPDGETLYFSSDGWPGMGSLDIFYSRRDAAGSWSAPVNLGYPINTFREETGMTVSTDGQEAFLAADLPGGYGKLDLYSFRLPVSALPRPLCRLSGRVCDADTRQWLDARVELTDLQTGESRFNDYTGENDGVFSAVLPVNRSYAVQVRADGYLFYSGTLFTSVAAGTVLPEMEIPLHRLKQGGEMVLNNLFFASGKYELLPASLTELHTLTRFLLANPAVQIEIQGHTDNTGQPSANLQLSVQRAKSVYDYLCAHAVAPDRLRFNGYGDTRPVAENGSAAGKQLNRRTSFLITLL